MATLPSARRPRLRVPADRQPWPGTALQDGADLVFLSAGDDDVARLYSKVGFRRVGTACIAEPAPVTA